MYINVLYVYVNAFIYKQLFFILKHKYCIMCAHNMFACDFALASARVSE